ncbi:hypothetical protein [Kitasatospora cheerisanensis]|uniref:Uncharacterized protein n=1 Tax=Kitasatospora cheerisanensis KCTC 2395 TaxID=1348663 RepID=A0A066Z211_9ACTN|nr:hypothetical protein [Kitasatospora cheerisanensis]KDN84391.1 hypothetical protein KCH_41820 [Kitasatospora cheerisanensis KCTC 2395]
MATTAPTPKPTASPRPQSQLPPTQTRIIAGARHLTTAIGHWAGGHTISAEELTRRIVKARTDAHGRTLAEHARLAQQAHNRATKLRRRAEQNGGLVPADQTALAAAEHTGARHDAALAALADFDVTALDPGQVLHRRHLIAAARYGLLSLPAFGMLAAAWLWDGSVVLVVAVAAAAAALIRGDHPIHLTVRPVPADLIAATPLVPAAEPAAPAPEPAVETPSGEWREQLLRYVEYAVSHARQNATNGVHARDLLGRLQAEGRFLDYTTETFPAVLRSAGVPLKVVKIKGDGQLGVHYDHLTKALGRLPRLARAKDYTERPEQEQASGE